MLFGSLCSLFIGSTDVKNTVCLWLKLSSAINLEFLMECKLTAHPIWWMYSKKLCGIKCPVVKDQYDCVLNDLEELGSEEFLVLTDRYSVEIFSCCLCFLPSCSSIHHQINVESSQIYSEDHLSFSRIRSDHLLFEVILRAEEECLVFLPLGTLDRIELLVQYQSMFLYE